MRSVDDPSVLAQPLQEITDVILTAAFDLYRLSVASVTYGALATLFLLGALRYAQRGRSTLLSSSVAFTAVVVGLRLAIPVVMGDHFERFTHGTLPAAWPVQALLFLMMGVAGVYAVARLRRDAALVREQFAEPLRPDSATGPVQSLLPGTALLAGASELLDLCAQARSGGPELRALAASVERELESASIYLARLGEGESARVGLHSAQSMIEHAAGALRAALSEDQQRAARELQASATWAAELPR